ECRNRWAPSRPGTTEHHRRSPAIIPRKAVTKRRTVAESPVGSEYARTRDIVVAAAVLLALTAVLVVVLVQAWPPAPAVALDGGTETPAPATTVELFGWSPTLSRETSMFVVVMAAGALGAVVHVLRSFYWYVGNRALRRSWLVMYLLLPF